MCRYTARFQEVRMPTIFISYRREDSAYITGRIYESIAARFGKDHVFMDLASLRGGDDYLAGSNLCFVDNCAGRHRPAMADSDATATA